MINKQKAALYALALAVAITPIAARLGDKTVMATSVFVAAILIVVTERYYRR